MTLSEYLREHGLTAARFAEEIGVSQQAVQRYAQGLRVPRKAIMHRIEEATGGAVQAQDFYNQRTRDAA